MRILISYANALYAAAQKFNTRTGLSLGGFDCAIEYHPSHIDSAFREKHLRILSHPRGNGYWLWKPYFILKTLESVADGDYVFYSDAGAHFVHSIGSVIRQAERDEQDIMLFNHIRFEQEIKWTKREVFDIVGSGQDDDEIALTSQAQAGCQLYRKSPISMEFAHELLRYSTTGTLITDAPSMTGPEDGRFVEHRHDQSILSVLAKMYELPLYRSLYAGEGVETTPSDYPKVVELTHYKAGRRERRL